MLVFSFSFLSTESSSQNELFADKLPLKLLSESIFLSLLKVVLALKKFFGEYLVFCPFSFSSSGSFNSMLTFDSSCRLDSSKAYLSASMKASSSSFFAALSSSYYF